MNVLVNCEESQAVCLEFRKLGHEAYSCDIKDCSGGYPKWHLKMDAFEALKFKKWDMIIMHPPCTAIAVSGNATYAPGKPLYTERIKAIAWTHKLWEESIKICDKVSLENPVGVLGTKRNFPKPTYIQPWQFGHGETKKTGLWLFGLPKLKPENIVEGREQKIWKMPPSKDRSILRSKTYHGIAKAMAEQWGKLLTPTPPTGGK